MALSQIQKAIDTMSTWADKINDGFHLADTNRVDINGHNTEIAANLTYIGENQVAIADNVTAIGLNTTASGNNTTKNTTQDGRLDALEVVPGVAVPVPADTFVFIDLDDGLKYTTSIRDAIGASQLNAIAAGAMAVKYTATATPTALLAFGDTFYTSTPTGISDSGDSTGLTLNVPVKYRIVVTASMAAGSGEVFVFQVYVGGNPVGRTVTATGDGATKYMNFAMQCVTTTTVTPTDKVELKVTGTTEIDLFDADMFVDFAGT
jgi:hypothetical protein